MSASNASVAVLALLLLLPSAALLASPAPRRPMQVARAYLQAGAAQDEARVRELLDPACHGDEGSVRVDAVRMLGVVMTIESLEMRRATVTGDTATVAYTVRGSASGDQAETTLFGAKVKVQGLRMEGASRSGVLKLRRFAGAWKVTCDAATARPR